MSTRKDVVVGGQTILVSTNMLVTKDVLVKSAINREQRRKLPADKLKTYLERMKRIVVKTPFSKFQNQIDLKDTKELVEASDLLANISKLKQHLRNYNADDALKILQYEDDNPSDVGKPVDILNLEKKSVTRDEVSKSKIWWHSVVEVDNTMTVYENLQMSLLFFKNNVEQKLHSTVMD